VANYPWDGTEDRRTRYSESPDDEAFIHLARVYAEAHALMSSSQEFPGGITNGAHWYPLWGGMQVRVCMQEFPLVSILQAKALLWEKWLLLLSGPMQYTPAGIKDTW